MDNRRVRAYRGASAIGLVAGLVLLLAWPLIGADRIHIFRVHESDSRIGPSSLFIPSPEITIDKWSDLATGVINGRSWHLLVGAGSTWWCYSFRVGEEPSNEGIACNKLKESGGGSGSSFMPAPLSKGLGRSILTAGLPGRVAEIRLRTTNDAPIIGELVRPPAELGIETVLLVAFLPPVTDVIEAEAFDVEGHEVSVSRLVDQVDAY